MFRGPLTTFNRVIGEPASLGDSEELASWPPRFRRFRGFDPWLHQSEWGEPPGNPALYPFLL